MLAIISYSILEPCYSKCGPLTSNTINPWEHVDLMLQSRPTASESAA